MRNPLTAQLCAKTMPYRGLGSGIKADPKTTKEAMAKVLGMSKPGIKKNIDKLIAAGRIKRIGTFGGHWEILDQQMV